ncbi:hypothetical protein D9758_010327 [Tetrapyrgos nigripes]|uniref:WD40 repeat-like protein n=1 Tax=Tetrapyrgos nigripes TaxID=182062 RepID=A0A8H5CZB9_9AGAR|nr:hypothetical protein D9758_010327 [Tetrapyrgos nigripes]
MLSQASNFSIHSSTLNNVGRDMITTTNNYYNAESLEATLREKLTPIINHVQKKDTCMEGTRIQVLNDLCEWVVNPDSKIAWVFGIAGTGKSAIAVSVAERFREINDKLKLALTFHCVKGQETSSTSLLAPTMCYHLAKVFGGYGRSLAQKFEQEPSLNAAGLPLKHQFAAFLNPVLLPAETDRHVAIIIDGLDEWGGQEQQDILIELLIALSLQLKWLRIVITSRPQVKVRYARDAEIAVRSFDLMEQYHASEDIRQVLRSKLMKLGAWEDIEPHVETLTEKAAGLFIWAMTASKFIENGKDEVGNLEIILALRKSNDQGNHNVHAELYALYKTILEESFKDSQDQEFFRKVIGVLLVVMEPISPSVLSKLVESGLSPKIVQKVLHPLQALLYEVNGKLYYHLSFADFITSTIAPVGFCLHLLEYHGPLVNRCMSILMEELRFNICDLKTSVVKNAQIASLADDIKLKVSAQLQFSCVFWTHHLKKAETLAPEILENINIFISGKWSIYWIECMSLLGKVYELKGNMSSIELWANKMKIYQIEAFADQARKLLDNFAVPLNESTAHLYISALPMLQSHFAQVKISLSAGQPEHIQQKKRKSITKVIKNAMSKVMSPISSKKHWQSHAKETVPESIQQSGTGLLGNTNWLDLIGKYLKKGVNIGNFLLDAQLLTINAKSRVQQVAYSPDGRHVASGSDDRTVRIWDTQTGQQVGQPLEGHTSRIWSVAYSPDGRHVASGSSDRTVRIWDTQTGQQVGQPLEGHTSWISSVAYSPDGRHVASGSEDRTVRIWDTQTGQQVGQLLEGHTSWIRSVAYSPDGRHVASGSEDRTVRIWDTQTGQQVGQPLEGHTSWIWSVAYSPDGRHVASGSEDRTVRIWDTQTGQKVGQLLEGHTRGIRSVAYSPDGRHVASGSSDRTVRIWDTQTGQQVGQPLEGHTSWIWSVAYSPDGRHVASGSEDRTVRIWDTQTGQQVGQPLEGHTSQILSVAYSPDGRHVASGSSDRTVRIWDTQTGQQVGQPLEGHTSRIWSVAYSPDGRHVASGSEDRTVRIWDTQTGQQVGQPLEGHTSRISSVAYSPDGRHVASGSEDRTVRIWDTQTGQQVGQPLEGHTSWIWSVAYSPDGRHVASGSSDRTVRIWDTQTGQQVGQPLEGHTSWIRSVAYSPDARHVASGSEDRTVRIWDTQTAQQVGQPLEGHTHWISSVAYSPDGRHVASGPEGRHIASGLEDKTVQSSDTSIEPTCAHTSEGLVQSYAHSPKNESCFVDDDGWLHTPGPNSKLILWLPPNIRGGFADHRQVLTIPPNADNFAVKVNWDNFIYGKDWTSVWEHNKS